MSNKFNLWPDKKTWGTIGRITVYFTLGAIAITGIMAVWQMVGLPTVSEMQENRCQKMKDPEKACQCYNKIGNFGYVFLLKDGNACYSGDKVKDFKLFKVADPKSFKVAGNFPPVYAKDSTQIYCKGQVLIGADPITFKIDKEVTASNQAVLASDKNHSYKNCALVK